MDSRIWKVIIAVAALHVVVLGSIFVINHGCKKTQPETAKPELMPAPPIPPAAPAAPAPGSVANLPPQSYPTPPTPPPVAPPVEPTPAAKSYTIKQGDTLGKIAKLENVSVADLTSANPGLDPKKLKPGQEIKVPAAGESHGAAAGSPAGAPSSGKSAVSGNTYTVQKGDTLGKIA